MTPRKVVIGTRGSDLALWQANTAAALIDAETELSIVKTSGDRFQNIALQGQSTQGFFTKEIELLLLNGEIDVAVHSLKDLPTEITPGLVLGAYLKRAPVSDLLLVNPDWVAADNLVPLKPGCCVGATSLRRQALLRLYRPEAEAALLRGNVPSRVEKCRAGEYGAIILARAGVERLGLKLDDLNVYELDPELWLPAPGQGAVAIQVRAGDAELLDLLEKANDSPTRRAADLERRLLANFEGGCHTAFGAWARDLGAAWDLSIGLEDERGWRAYRTAGSYEELERIGPASGIEFSPPSVGPQEALCRPIRW